MGNKDQFENGGISKKEGIQPEKIRNNEDFF